MPLSPRYPPNVTLGAGQASSSNNQPSRLVLASAGERISLQGAATNSDGKSPSLRRKHNPAKIADAPYVVNVHWTKQDLLNQKLREAYGATLSAQSELFRNCGDAYRNLQHGFYMVSSHVPLLNHRSHFSCCPPPLPLALPFPPPHSRIQIRRPVSSDSVAELISPSEIFLAAVWFLLIKTNRKNACSAILENSRTATHRKRPVLIQKNLVDDAPVYSEMTVCR